jgi:anti-repressor protein
MQELIKISYENERPTVLGRDLHEFLEVGTEYRHWFPRMCEYGFAEGVDYTPFNFEHPQNKQLTTDHQMTMDMAKELAMIQRNEKGKQARQYFIELEKQWNTPEAIMARALQFAKKQLEGLTLQISIKDQVIKELKPKADYMDSILKNKGLVSITQISKDYGMSGIKMNELLHELGVQYKQSEQWLLYAKHQDKGYTHSETIDIIRKDGRPDITMNTKWTQKGRLFIYDLLKSEKGIVPLIER